MATTASPSPGYVGSERRPGSWPSEYPTHTIAALVLGLATFLAVPTYQYWRHWAQRGEVAERGSDAGQRAATGGRL